MPFTVNTKDAGAVAVAVQGTFAEAMPSADWSWLRPAFEWAERTFHGREPGFQAVDTPYHDFEHTLQITLCLARILCGRAKAGARPTLDTHWVRLATFAALLHDIGYLKPVGDSAGTGAKLTFTHVGRSAMYAAELLRERNFSGDDIAAVQRVIRCTGTRVTVGMVPFGTEAERVVACALATADLLGQMAAADYVERVGDHVGVDGVR